MREIRYQWKQNLDNTAPFLGASNTTVVVKSQGESLRFLVLKVDENKRISDIVSCVLFVYFPAECFYVLCLVCIYLVF